MKKIGIITFHFVNNFGGALQAYALRRVVEDKCNVSAEIIDYHNWFIELTDTIRLFPITTNISEFVSGLKTMRNRFRRIEKFNDFNIAYNKLTRRYWNKWQLKCNPPGDDKYICGSDQIWNPFLTMGIVPNYFLNFESNPANKIAYAPSLGTDGVPYVYRRKIRKFISSIEHLSVREKSGQEFIKELTGRNAKRLIDPTFLLTKREWESVGKNPMQTKEPYILLYIMQSDSKMYEYAKKIKDKMGIKLVEISRYGYQPGFVDEIVIDVGPEEFLGLFRDATYVCTNSYHGLAYSIIFEKEFCLVPCKRFTARINNMLDLLHIELATDTIVQNELSTGYDKDYVRTVINEERSKAVEFLRESIGN